LHAQPCKHLHGCQNAVIDGNKSGQAHRRGGTRRRKGSFKSWATWLWRTTDKMSGNDAVSDEDLQVAVLWGDVDCPDRGGHEGRR